MKIYKDNKELLNALLTFERESSRQEGQILQPKS